MLIKDQLYNFLVLIYATETVFIYYALQAKFPLKINFQFFLMGPKLFSFTIRDGEILQIFSFLLYDVATVQILRFFNSFLGMP